MNHIIQTKFTNNVSPFTNKVPMREIPVPQIAMPRKGHTKYDAEFERLLTGHTAIESTEAGFEVLRRALMRFLKFRDLEGKYSVRRQINRETRKVAIWLQKKPKETA